MRISYCYLIRLKWKKGFEESEHVLSVCSNLKQLKYVLLDIIIDLQNKYTHVDQDYERFILAENFGKEYHKSFDDVLQELKDTDFSSMIKYWNAPEKYEGIWDSEHVSYELLVEKIILNSWHNPIEDIM